MLVLLAPGFAGTDEQYAELARATGMVPYDLRTRCKPGVWGVIRALGNEEQAEALSRGLRELGFPSCLVDSAVAHDPDRQVVSVRRIDFETEQMTVHLRERAMTIPYKALIAIVRGEAQIGRTGQGAGSGVSSASFRAVNPSPVDVAVFREQASTGPRDAFAALDLHFATVLWLARLDARTFEFEASSATDSPANDLDRLAEFLGERAGVRVDRNIRISSLSSFTARHIKSSAAPSGSISHPPRAAQTDEHFDAYSRLVAEAERQCRRLGI
jgi:hypothetical protein